MQDVFGTLRPGVRYIPTCRKSLDILAERV